MQDGLFISGYLQYCVSYLADGYLNACAYILQMCFKKTPCRELPVNNDFRDTGMARKELTITWRTRK